MTSTALLTMAEVAEELGMPYFYGTFLREGCVRQGLTACIVFDPKKFHLGVRKNGAAFALPAYSVAVSKEDCGPSDCMIFAQNAMMQKGGELREFIYGEFLRPQGSDVLRSGHYDLIRSMAYRALEGIVSEGGLDSQFTLRSLQYLQLRRDEERSVSLKRERLEHSRRRRPHRS